MKEGALKGNSPAEVVNQCDITFSCVSDPTALKDVSESSSAVHGGYYLNVIWHFYRHHCNE